MTEQYSNDDLVRAIERRRNQFLLETGIHLTHSQVSYTVPNTTGRISLSDSIIDIRRASWLESSDFNPLWRMDEWDANTLRIGWNTTTGSPSEYSFYLTPKVAIQIIPRSTNAGSIDLITVNNPANLDTSTGISLNIPDDFSWILKWGALADLLSRDGQALDSGRAKYCQERFQQGLEIALQYSLIETAYIDDVAIQPQSITDFDSLTWNWQDLSGAPTNIAICGRNLVALSPVPDGIYTITLDINRNAPMPSLDADNIQIGKEQFDIILDYAVHLAMFKQGYSEIQQTLPLVDRFLKVALGNNSRLSAEARNYDIMKALSRKEEIDRPRREMEIEV
jgi:hypothetical protein